MLNNKSKVLNLDILFQGLLVPSKYMRETERGHYADGSVGNESLLLRLSN